MARKIPVTVLTGFLGAGKTTLIRHLLENADNRNIALIINEFGDLGVDSEMIMGCRTDACDAGSIIELTNGCICCTVSEDFVPALQTILAGDRQPDHIVVETSGLALPQPLVHAFNWPDLRTRLTVDGVIAVVDCGALVEGRLANDLEAIQEQRVLDDNLDHETPIAELFEDQLAAADIIVLNKTDLVDGNVARELKDRFVRESRNGTRVLSTSYGALSIDVLLGLSMSAESDEAGRQAVHHLHGDHDDHDHDEFESFVVELQEVADPQSFFKRIRAVSSDHEVLRIKGFAAVADRPMRMAIQGVGSRLQSYFDRPFRPDEQRRTRLVVIGMHGLEQEKITGLLSGSAAPQFDDHH